MANNDIELTLERPLDNKYSITVVVTKTRMYKLREWVGTRLLGIASKILGASKIYIERG